jgi:tRNA(His) guanylyltransferase
MKFEALDRRMRVYETAHDHRVLPGIHLVARIDGRSFSHLTRETAGFEAPYDERFRDCMIAACARLMDCGFAVLYAYTQSDEINLLFRRDESTFGRKERKFLSVLAGEASVAFSLALGAPGVFDCRISQLPRDEDVVDYFRWRHEDAHRNALNAHCYWLLRRQGLDDHTATKQLEGVSVAARNELLFAHGINFNEVPTWHRRGIGLYAREQETAGVDPRDGSAVTITRRVVVTDFELPMKDAYDAFIRGLVTSQGAPSPPRK